MKREVKYNAAAALWVAGIAVSCWAMRSQAVEGGMAAGSGAAEPLKSIAGVVSERVGSYPAAGDVAAPAADEDVVSLSSGAPTTGSLTTAVPASLTEEAPADVAVVEPVVLPDAATLVSDASGSGPVSDQAWDFNEFDRMAAPAYQVEDSLARLPVGAVITPPEPMNVDELLSVNQAETPVGYALPGLGAGQPFKIGTGDPALASKRSIAQDQIQIESTDFIDYDEEHSMVYGQGRITVRYGIYKLTADRLMIDTRIREIQAYGNVELHSPTETIKAESMWFDAENSQGVAYNGRGHTGDFYILSHDPHCTHGTNIRQVSSQETVIKDASFTACEFPVPHYRLRAKEFTIMASDRVFARNVVLYILEKPVLWLPYFTRKLNDQNPWGITAGTDGELGGFVRLFYDFHHSCYTPSDVDDNIMIRANDGHGRVRLDYFSKRGFGQGLDYSYYLNHGKHFGHLFAYRLADSERDVSGEDGGERQYIDWYHRTRITEELDWLVNLDYGSDPDIFFDTLDRVRSSGDYDRGRLSERVAQTGIEWTAEDFYAGLQVELKDRIGRDRVSNYGEFRDGDFDFDRRFNDEDTFTLLAPGVGPDGFNYPNAGRYLDPASLDYDNLDDSISSRRYGRVTERLPHLRVTSNRMRLWCLPLWYHLDLNVFNNLDKGLNTVGTEDDSFVRGFDLYQSISHLAKFCDRYTLLTKVGLGAGVAEREDDSFNLDFPAGATFPFVFDGQVIDGHPLGLTFTDKDTFLVGRREMSLSQVEPAFVYGDIDSRFNARISECLSAFIRYRFREGTDDNLGTFYESIGSRKTMDDLYNFRTPEHWIEGGLTYALADPRFALNFNMGRNLQGDDQITPNELLGYTNLGVSYTNLRNTWLVNAGVGMQERQLRDITDPNAFTQNSLTYYVSSSYMPVHQRHWGRLSAYFIQNGEEDPLLTTDDNGRNFDTRDEAVIDGRIGKKIGTKYLVELRSRIRSRATDNQDTYIRVERDFHDLIAGVTVGMRKEGLSEDNDEGTEQDNLQVRFNLKFKPGSQKGVVPVVKSNRLFNGGRGGALAR